MEFRYKKINVRYCHICHRHVLLLLCIDNHCGRLNYGFVPKMYQILLHMRYHCVWYKRRHQISLFLLCWHNFRQKLARFSVLFILEQACATRFRHTAKINYCNTRTMQHYTERLVQTSEASLVVLTW